MGANVLGHEEFFCCNFHHSNRLKIEFMKLISTLRTLAAGTAVLSLSAWGL